MIPSVSWLVSMTRSPCLTIFLHSAITTLTYPRNYVAPNITFFASISHVTPSAPEALSFLMGYDLASCHFFLHLAPSHTQHLTGGVSVRHLPSGIPPSVSSIIQPSHAARLPRKDDQMGYQPPFRLISLSQPMDNDKPCRKRKRNSCPDTFDLRYRRPIPLHRPLIHCPKSYVPYLD